MNGPSAAEQTDEYAPPEVSIFQACSPFLLAYLYLTNFTVMNISSKVLLSQNWIPFDPNNPSSYDSWSIGIVGKFILEVDTSVSY